MADELDFDTGASGASDTIPMQCSALRKGGFVVVKNRPCKIVEMSTSKTGKHGHAKVHLVALDIFTGKKYEDICPSTHNMNVPMVSRREFEVIDLDAEGYFNLMDMDNGETREDLKIGELCQVTSRDEVLRLKEKAEKEGNVLMATVLKAMKEEIVKELNSKKPTN